MKLRIMKILYKCLKNKTMCLFIILTMISLFSCKTPEIKNKSESSENSYVVTKVKKLSSDVYVIYATRNDTIFKIASFFNGKKPANGKKLTKRTRFHANLYSQFKALEEKYKMIPQYGIYIDFHNVAISKEPGRGIDDVWISKDLDGPYLLQKCSK